MERIAIPRRRWPTEVRCHTSGSGRPPPGVDLAPGGWPSPQCHPAQLLKSSHPVWSGQPASRAVPVLCGTREPSAQRVRHVRGCVCHQRTTRRPHGCLRTFTPAPVTTDIEMCHHGRRRRGKLVLSLLAWSLRRDAPEPSSPARKMFQILPQESREAEKSSSAPLIGFFAPNRTFSSSKSPTHRNSHP